MTDVQIWHPSIFSLASCGLILTATRTELSSWPADMVPGGPGERPRRAGEGPLATEKDEEEEEEEKDEEEEEEE